MERKIPNLSKSICTPLMGIKDLERTSDLYLEKISNFERKVEKRFIELLKLMDTQGFVKTVPDSLPYNKEIVVTLNGESWMNGPYEYKRVFRRIINQLAPLNFPKIRFYFYINVLTDLPSETSVDRLLNSWGKVEYRFRYYEAPEKLE